MTRSPTPAESPPDSIEQLSQALRQAREAVQARDDFLAIAAHELRSPMHALALQLAVLERSAAALGAAPLVTDIRRAQTTLDRYVRRATVLLDVTQLQAGRPVLRRSRVDAGELVREVVQAYAAEAAFHGSRLEADAAGEVAGCWDAHMVEEILANLVSNAIKYGGGTPVRIGLAADADCAYFTVADSGPGIAEDQRSRMFARFERLVSNSRQRSGFGLGLWIVGRMVQAHGGSIEVRSRPGEGAAFRVTLPLAEPQENQRHKEAQA